MMETPNGVSKAKNYDNHILYVVYQQSVGRGERWLTTGLTHLVFFYFFFCTTVMFAIVCLPAASPVLARPTGSLMATHSTTE